MKKLLPILIIGVLMATAVTAASFGEGGWRGCPSSQPGCPGYEEFEPTKPASGSMPHIIKGKLGSTRMYVRDYEGSCWWKAGEGQVCFEGAKAKTFPTRRFRKEVRLRERFSTDKVELRKDLETLRDNTQQPNKFRSTHDAGPRMIASGKFTGFKWRGAYAGLHEKYRE